MQVAVRELKARLSQLLARAQEGEIIEITSHKRPIARIIGVPSGLDPSLRALIGRGGLAWKGGKPRMKPPLKLVATGVPVSRLVLEDRG